MKFLGALAVGTIACGALAAAPPAQAQAKDPVTFVKNLFDNSWIGNNVFGTKPTERTAQEPKESRDSREPRAQREPRGEARQQSPGGAAKPLAIGPADRAQASETAAEKAVEKAVVRTPARAATKAAAREIEVPSESTGTAGVAGGEAVAVTEPRIVHPLPPRRPGSRESGAAFAAAPSRDPSRDAVAREEPEAAPLTQGAALARVNAFLNGFEQITGTFVQLNPDGQRVGGSILVQRPGRLRFKYDPPSTLEVVADGRSVAVREARYPPQVYSMSETPLKFLLKEKVDLAADAKIVSIRLEPDGLVTVSLEDAATLGGTSRLTLVFDSKANLLRRWDVVDPQGYKTSVALNNLDVTRRQ